MNAFHFLHAYLYPTENWCYRIIKHLPDTNVTIVTDALRGAEAFPLPGARFLVAPLPWDVSTWWWPLRNAVAAARLPTSHIWSRYVAWQARRATVFHAHFSFMGWNYLPLAKALRKPLIVSFYGYDYEWIPKNRPGWKENYAILFRDAALFVTEGAAGRAKLIAQGCSPDKIRVAHLGVDLEHIPFITREKQSQDLKLVQVATFTEKKGQATTARAFIAAAADCPQMTLTFVGKDPDGLRGPIQKEIAEAGLSDRVRFIDFIDFAKLHEFLSQFQVFIHPSCHAQSGDSEGGAPIVLLDAQATGMPVIATRHCDIPEEVIEGVTGLLSDEGDHQGVATSIRRFYEMGAEEYSTMARNARAHIQAHYEIKSCASRLRAIYDEARA